MKILELEINHFKSIMTKQSIDMSKPLISLIGKNGSGKTNVLDSIFTIFNSNHSNDRKDINYRFYLELDDEDKEEFKEFITPEHNGIIEVYHDDNVNRGDYININRVKSPMIKNILKSIEESIYTLSNELKKELEGFSGIIRELAYTGYENCNFSIDVDFEEEDLKKSTNYGWIFESLLRENEELIKKVKEIIDENLSGDELIIKYHYMNHRIYYPKHRNFKLVYSRPKLTKFESKYVKIDEEAIKDEIEKINQLTDKYRKNIDSLYSKLENRLKKLYRMLDESNRVEEEANDRYESIWQKIVSVCNPKIYYLKSENNQLFFKKQDRWNTYYHSINEKTIIETFLKYRYPTIKENEINKQIDNNELSQEEISELSFDLEQFINNNLPSYEQDMIDKIKVSEDLSFSIIEKSGEVIPFSETNAGRRWFFTYFFIKGCLQKGDVLLLDEPASTLHPEAQTHIRKELEELSKMNKIVLSTHSPYMISSDSQVYYLEITENGTMLQKRNNVELHSMLVNLGVQNSIAISGDLLINNNLLPLKMVGQRIKIALKELGLTQRNYADEYNISEREIRRKLSGQHLSYYDIEWFCNRYNYDPMKLIMDNTEEK